MALPAAIRLTLALTLDGTPLTGFPVERRLTGASTFFLDFIRSADGDDSDVFETAPIQVTPVSALLLTTPDQLRIQLNEGEVQPFYLGGNGLLLLTAANVTALATANPGDEAVQVTIQTLVPEA